MISLTTPFGRATLAWTGEMRLHELSLRAHVSMKLGLERGIPAGPRVIGFPARPVNLNRRERAARVMCLEYDGIGYS